MALVLEVDFDTAIRFSIDRLRFLAKIKEDIYTAEDKTKWVCIDDLEQALEDLTFQICVHTPSPKKVAIFAPREILALRKSRQENMPFVSGK